jgi:GNAT superfamily N-acetyltransferase
MTLAPLSPLATFRAATAGDETFLRSLYADLRGPALADLPGERATLQIALEYEARAARYAAYDDAVEEVIELDRRPVGRILVATTPGVPGGRTVVDLTVLRAQRGQGIGRAALVRWADVAHAAGGPLTLTLLDGDPALTYYHRLGFRMVRAVGTSRIRMVLDPGASILR